MSLRPRRQKPTKTKSTARLSNSSHITVMTLTLPVVKHILHIAPTPTPKTYKNKTSPTRFSKSSHITGGGGITKRFTTYIYIIYIYIY